MSADNYMLVRQVGKWFYVSMEFASDEEPMPIDPEHCKAFDNLEAATRCADSEWTEYGIRFQLEATDERQ